MLKNFAFQTAKRELEGYKSNLELGNIEDNGKILAYHCLIISLFIKKKPILKQVYNEERDIYNKEISILVLDTNKLSNEFRRLIHNNVHGFRLNLSIMLLIIIPIDCQLINYEI